MSQASTIYMGFAANEQACVELSEAKGWRSAVLLHEGSALPVAALAPDAEARALVPRQLPPPDDDALLRSQH